MYLLSWGLFFPEGEKNAGWNTVRDMTSLIVLFPPADIVTSCFIGASIFQYSV